MTAVVVGVVVVFVDTGVVDVIAATPPCVVVVLAEWGVSLRHATDAGLPKLPL